MKEHRGVIHWLSDVSRETRWQHGERGSFVAARRRATKPGPRWALGAYRLSEGFGARRRFVASSAAEVPRDSYSELFLLPRTGSKCTRVLIRTTSSPSRSKQSSHFRSKNRGVKYTQPENSGWGTSSVFLFRLFLSNFKTSDAAGQTESSTTSRGSIAVPIL